MQPMALFSKDSFIIGKRVHNLYLLGQKFKIPKSIHLVSCNKYDITLWHHRLGHLPFEKLKLLSTTNKGCNNDVFNTCNVCYQAIQHILSFSLSENVSHSIFDLVHVDLWRPYKVQTYNGFKYFFNHCR